MTDGKTPFTIEIVMGPTASGKSAYALGKARTEGGVIINADAMQMYDALPLLTAQPTDEEKRLAPHRLYGVIPASQDCRVTDWVAQARAEIAVAEQAGLRPFIVGGTGFYIKALAEGLSPIPDIPETCRHEAEQAYLRLGGAAFREALAARDPVMAARLNENDRHRLIRAWEVMAATGKSLAFWQAQPPAGTNPTWRFRYSAILPEREAHRARIKARFEKMLEAGVLGEVAALAARVERGEVPGSALILKAHGFRPLRAYLRGEITLAEAAERTVNETRQYAKRQRTWLRTQIPPEKLEILPAE